MGALRDDTPKGHPDNGPGQDLGLCRVFKTRSRAKVLNRIDSGQALRDDSMGELVDDSPFCHPAELPARISVPREK